MEPVYFFTGVVEGEFRRILYGKALPKYEDVKDLTGPKPASELDWGLEAEYRAVRLAALAVLNQLGVMTTTSNRLLELFIQEVMRQDMKTDVGWMIPELAIWNWLGGATKQ